ncbi:DNA polymerase III subunit delta [Lacticaseibacillus thailandensis]|uniref:DNA polymerase III subunit delta n=1 Tax=Lacticaseibacillus thailandensis TaxID=381741 RepID=UPI0006D05427|nr:DNA polymerase III subunit delta [Lacticaseibacillus thailandensis]
MTGSGSVAKQESAINDLVDYLQQPAPTTVLVLLANYPKLDARKRVVKALKKAATMVATKPLSEAEARRAIRAELSKQRVDIDHEGLDALIARTQSDYSAMVAALPKLSMYAHNTGKVDAQAVTQLVPRQLTDSVFDMVNSVMQRNVAAALRQYRELLQQQEEPLRLISLLESQFRLLIQVQIFSTRAIRRAPPRMR